MPTALITGASRGLGLGLAEVLVADHWLVHACCRNPEAADRLKMLKTESEGRLIVHTLDVLDHSSIEALANSLVGQPIDALLNVAGYYGTPGLTEPGGLQEFGNQDFDDWIKIYRTNVIGPMKMCEVFIENVAASERRIMISLSSEIGSIAENDFGKMYAYRASKAALNAIMKSMSVDLSQKGVVAVPLHPGWVRTDMGGPEAPCDVQTSVAGMKKVIDEISLKHSGKFMVYNGSELSW